MNSSRVSAIRELIETEQRYVDDLKTVEREFIQPLTDSQVLTYKESDQLFINWQNLIACNIILLQALKEQVDYRQSTDIPSDDQAIIRSMRSSSMSNIALAAQVRYAQQCWLQILSSMSIVENDFNLARDKIWTYPYMFILLVIERIQS
jgi:hypothetical protein